MPISLNVNIDFDTPWKCDNVAGFAYTPRTIRYLYDLFPDSKIDFSSIDELGITGFKDCSICIFRTTDFKCDKPNTSFKCPTKKYKNMFKLTIVSESIDLNKHEVNKRIYDIVNLFSTSGVYVRRKHITFKGL